MKQIIINNLNGTKKEKKYGLDCIFFLLTAGVAG
jgi:hypothetical protein